MKVFIDIDGTIAHAGRRFEQAGPEPSRKNKAKYKKWLAAVQSPEAILEDEPVGGMRELLEALDSEAQMYYLTSREESLRAPTLEWLWQHKFPVAELIMRSDGDWSDMAEFKHGQIEQRVTFGGSIIVIDDDEHGRLENLCKQEGWTFLKARSGGQR